MTVVVTVVWFLPAYALFEIFPFFSPTLKGDRGSPGGKGPPGQPGKKVDSLFFTGLTLKLKLGRSKSVLKTKVFVRQGPEGSEGRRGETGVAGKRVNSVF